MDRKKIFVISDHLYSPSGVGHMTRVMVETLLETGRYKFICFGGAIQHADYTPQRVDKWGDNLIIIPVNGYGDQEKVRSLLTIEKPDVLWFMTDPRFYDWLWDIENEVRTNVPMMYYHVWDNYPVPYFNRGYYLSNDKIVTISKVTQDIVEQVAPEVESEYLPHAVNNDVFKPFEHDIQRELYRKQFFGDKKDRCIFFWNNRNARRKMSGSVLWWFNEFAMKVGTDKVALIMHTESKDPNGQDLDAIIEQLGAADGRIMISREKMPAEQLAKVYATVDCTINISDAEGFGLSVSESLSSGTPVVVNRTGGMTEQAVSGDIEFGVAIHPASKAVIGSLQVPYIYEDRVSKEDFISALEKIYNMSKNERKQVGLAGREHILKNFSFKEHKEKWIRIFDEFIEKNGSWETRKNYDNVYAREII